MTLVDELLAQQRQLTAVERFGRQHDRGTRPLLESHYRALIPLSAPLPGEQYAFEVDLDACSGCKACVAACHSLNGLDEGETWREVGLLRGRDAHAFREGLDRRADPVARFVTTACHHCVEPACLLGCPVLAYDKDPSTGIVRHLDDQCIGCSYCILKCPYEVPRYSARRGIVRKCDMCQGRLAGGEAPACVQGCPNAAIRITVVPRDAVTLRFRGGSPAGPAPEGNAFLPDSPDPGITLPTTRYLSRAGLAPLQAADAAQARPAAAHWPLAWMLVLTQLGAGVLCGVVSRQGAGVPVSGLRGAALGGWGLLAAGLVASAFHLGRPLKAWRVWLGWRSSWLSREALALGGAAGIAAAFVASLWLPPPLHAVAGPLGGVLVASLVAAVLAQCMVYVDTRRATWGWADTGPRFLGTAAVAALLAADAPPLLPAALLLLLLALETRGLRALDDDGWTPRRRAAALRTGPLRDWATARAVLAVLAVPAAFARTPVPALALAGLAALAERSLFFRAVGHDRMPGAPGWAGPATPTKARPQTR